MKLTENATECVIMSLGQNVATLNNLEYKPYSVFCLLNKSIHICLHRLDDVHIIYNRSIESEEKTLN